MPRRNKIRDDLEDTGVMLAPDGYERGRLSMDGILVINHLAMFRWLQRYSAKKAGFVPLTVINAQWSITGGRGYDPYVRGALDEMHQHKLVEYKMDGPELISVLPVGSVYTEAKKLPKYVTRAEYLAGLEAIDDE